MGDPITSERFRSVAGLAGLSSAFEALFLAAPSPFLVVMPPDYTIIAVNDEYLRATMTERAAILGRGLFEVFPDNPDSPSAAGPRELRASLARVVAERRPDDMPVVRYDIPRPTDLGGGFEERWWSPRNAPLLGSDGDVVCVIHHVEDVTARVRVEAALRTSEHRFRALVTATSNMIYRMNADWSEMITLKGKDYLADATAPRSWLENYIPQDEQPRVLHAIQEAISGKRRFELEHRVLRADGVEAWIFSRAVPLFGDAGEITEWFGVAIDISERTRADEALRASEEKFRTLFESIDEGFCLIEVQFDEAGKAVDYRFLEVNPAFERQTGIANAVGRSMREIAPEHEEHWFEIYGRVTMTGEPVRFQHRATQLGRTYDVYAFRMGEGATRRVAILFNDITKRVEAEQALRASETAVREHATWLRGQGEALTAAVNGAPLDESLGALVSTAAQTLGDGVRVAFYLADGDGGRLHHVVGMSAEYVKAVDGFKSGPESLACGLATHGGQAVLTVDVQADPGWEPWRWLAQRFEYRGCWSFPVRSRPGTLVGTLALYWREPREATAREVQFASLLTHTAAIIISRHRESEVRQQAEDALRKSLTEREALLKELHHRVKNNLQVITSLLEMQVRQTADRHALSSLSEARNRIAAIGSIHEMLYQSASLSEVDLAAYARRLVRYVVSFYDQDLRISASVTGDGIAVDLAHAVPIGLLLNELVSNACKHAFPTKAGGELVVVLEKDDSRVWLHVNDNGVGLPNQGAIPLGKTLLAEQAQIDRRADTWGEKELQRKVMHIVERVTAREIDALRKPQPVSACRDQLKQMTLAGAVGPDDANESCLGIQYEFEILKMPSLGNLDSSYSQERFLAPVIQRRDALARVGVSAGF